MPEAVSEILVQSKGRHSPELNGRERGSANQGPKRLAHPYHAEESDSS